ATAIAGPGVVDKAEALANGLTAIARGFGVTDIVPSATGSATAATDPIAAAQQTANSSADEILMQGIADLTHANQLLEQAPTASLDPRQLALLTNTEKLLTSGLIPSNNQLDPAGLPSTDQAGLTDLSQGVLHGDQSLLDAVQGFVSADRAGDLTGPPILNPADLSLLAATFDAVGADYHMLGAEFGAAFFTVIGVPDIFLP
ncbi:hypothetical protein, partial [Mycobacterium sp.]|uniref:hypothetical protein n=1 Tax=Mycobacterium sp. TaxID=1785 RepID=UPI0025FA9883